MCLNKTFFILILFFILFPFSQAEAIFGISSRAAQKEIISQIEEAYAEKDYNTVEELSKEFLLKYPSASKKRLKTVYLLLGKSYKAEGQYDKAMLTYNEAVEFLPKDEEVNLALGEIYLIGELSDNAKSIFRKVLENNKDSKDALLGMAYAYYADGFFSRASDYFKQYEDYGGESNALFLYFYAMSQYLSNHSALALQTALRSLELEEKTDTLLLIAKIYKYSDNDTNAFEYINAAIKSAPERKDLYLTKALWLAFEPKTALEGGKMADTLLADHPKDKLALFIKAISLIRLGKKKEASAILKEINFTESHQFIDKMADKIYQNYTK